ncbi:hypothetical protein ElyMa_002664100 [Elysia marginata]|uniref:Uncharacterized protein n=1 Tax=Elysia marginata TaxID=1093978 RepID=A0AAV4H7M3_9GAST|nr:hypothetical protein ElyMa_002664100 [Elysia marginata]
MNTNYLLFFGKNHSYEVMIPIGGRWSLCGFHKFQGVTEVADDVSNEENVRALPHYDKTAPGQDCPAPRQIFPAQNGYRTATGLSRDTLHAPV